MILRGYLSNLKIKNAYWFKHNFCRVHSSTFSMYILSFDIFSIKLTHPFRPLSKCTCPCSKISSEASDYFPSNKHLGFLYFKREIFNLDKTPEDVYVMCFTNCLKIHDMGREAFRGKHK